MATSDYSVKINALDHEIEKVTVYVDRAAVTRRFRVNFKAGQNEVSIGRLPKVLESDSTRVETETTSPLQALTVFDVIYVSPQSEYESSQSDPFAELEDRRAILENRLQTIEQQNTVLSSYADGLSGKDTTAEELEAFLGIYGSRSEKSHALKLQLHEELENVRREIEEGRKKSNSEHEAKKSAGVNVVIFAEEEGEADVVLSYVVTKASWRSHYDVRANLGPQLASAKSDSPKITLQYRASISQVTGEDWNGVALTLSTASPVVGSEIPKLRPWTIGNDPIPVPPPLAHSSTYRASSSEGPLSTSDVKIISDAFKRTMKSADLMGSSLSEQLASIRENLPSCFKSSTLEAKPTKGAISSSFQVEGNSNIPSDGSSHKVSITTLELSSTLQWIAVPRKSPSAFLQCHIKNTSDYLLVSGPSSVFMDGNFVSKSNIPDVSPQESFSCSLGVDSSVKITYHPTKKAVRSQGGSIISKSSKQEVTRFSQHISVKNARPSSLSRLIVQDQVPNSEDSRIKVTLFQPDERFIGAPRNSYIASANKLGTGKNAETLSYTIQKGVMVQWAQKNYEGIEGSGGVRGDGVIEWICTDLESSVNLDLEYEVSGPYGLHWH